MANLRERYFQVLGASFYVLYDEVTGEVTGIEFNNTSGIGVEVELTNRSNGRSISRTIRVDDNLSIPFTAGFYGSISRREEPENIGRPQIRNEIFNVKVRTL